ncbi:unnamed protein product, partial [Laminaria digitata]
RERSSVGVSGGGVSSGEEVSSGDGVGDEGGDAAVETRSYGLGPPVPEALEEQAPRQEHMPPPASQDQGAAGLSENAELRCLLCTVWANPHLAPTQAAVDGRVNIPLSDFDYHPRPIRSSSGGTAAGVPTGRSGDPAEEKAGTTQYDSAD